MFVMPYAIVALSSLCFYFLCFGLMVKTRSRSYGLCHRPYIEAQIKWFGSSLLACLCSLASILMPVLAFIVLNFAMLDTFSGFMVVWLHP